jgi:hypothetical protein
MTKVKFNDKVTIHEIESRYSRNQDSNLKNYHYHKHNDITETESNISVIPDYNENIIPGYFDTVCYKLYDEHKPSREEINATVEAEESVKLINTFVAFYKVHYGEENSFHMFQDLTEEQASNGDTNKCMETFQLHMDEYYNNCASDALISIYDIDDPDYDFKLSKSYILTIKNKADKVCHTLLVLLKYITTINTDDWIIDVINTN